MSGGTNLYQFNGNNPVAYTDPFGLCPPVDNDPSNCTGSQILRWQAAHVSLAGNNTWNGVDARLHRAVINTSIRLGINLYVSSTNSRSDQHAAGSLHYEGRAADISRAAPADQQGALGEHEKLAYHHDIAAQIQGSMWNELGQHVQESMGSNAAWTSSGLNRDRTLYWIGRHQDHVHTGVKPEEQ